VFLGVEISSSRQPVRRGGQAKRRVEGFERATGKRSNRNVHRPHFRHQLRLRAIAGVYASSNTKETFVKDFIAAWTKVMKRDHYDLKK